MTKTKTLEGRRVARLHTYEVETNTGRVVSAVRAIVFDDGSSALVLVNETEDDLYAVELRLFERGAK